LLKALEDDSAGSFASQDPLAAKSCSAAG